MAVNKKVIEARQDTTALVPSGEPIREPVASDGPSS